MKFEDIENNKLDWVACFLKDNSVFDGDRLLEGWDWMVAEIRRLRKAIEKNQNNAQQLKAEIAEVVRYLEDNHQSSEFGPNHIISHVLGTLRQLSAV